MEQLIVFKHWWLIFIIVTCFDGAILWSWFESRVGENEDLRDGIRKVILGFVFWGNIPWTVMGIGSTIGKVPTLWHYFRPQDSNPYVLAWFASGLLIWILGFYWVFYRGGAELLSRNFWFLNRALSNTTSVKALYVLGAVTMIFGIVLMVILDLPIPVAEH